MPNYFVLRLTPPAAIDGPTFTTYLTGLTIKFYDISFAAPTGGTFLGSAVFVPPALAPPIGPPPVGTGIVQHLTRPFFIPPLTSVATAVIQFDPPVPPAGPLGPEYVARDLRIEFDRGGPKPLVDSRVHYNVQFITAPAFPLQTKFQSIPDAEVSAFLTLPPANSPFTAPSDGTPPKFDDLLAAVKTVLTADPGGVVALDGLSVDQCRTSPMKLYTVDRRRYQASLEAVQS